MNNIHVVITGPESTGKSTLTRAIGQHYGACVLDEFAREYLIENGPEYDFSTLDVIGQMQWDRERSALLRMKGLLVSDTSAEVLRIWSEDKYGKVSRFISQYNEWSSPDLYILCHWSVPWIQDIQRENPSDRERLYRLYLDYLISKRIPIVKVMGDKSDVLGHSIAAIDRVMKISKIN